ncbi:Ig-like domain-containing protein [Colwellia echini]|uniref:BIG2 domain-containing protein n=1 Tax=Colwellia echini TaxID=1982103 RepID=A0ABY3MYL5_9GAMM|nr:Ig-like domain-containing protein [Colwellia echini]TYK66236.1 hypothetical protein CWS31_006460 [Colwellia echini]
MKTNLLKNTILMSIISASLAGCGNEGGYDYNFSADHPVLFPQEPIEVSFNEETGLMEVDLLAGATVNGVPVGSVDKSVYVRDFLFTVSDPSFVTPQVVVNVPNQPASPFNVSNEGSNANVLFIDTDMFAESLRMCDDTDVRGGTDADGNAVADGKKDFPESISYDITYLIDNGYEYELGVEKPTRTLKLTINANTDPVKAVVASDVSVPVGGTGQVLAATVPAYACNNKLTYSIVDTAIAEVDAAGEITGKNVGETNITVTSDENSELTSTAIVNVTSDFTLEVTNQRYNELGAPLGTKLVPTCVHTGLDVIPKGTGLTGAYTYDWTSSNTNLVLAASDSDGGFGAIGRFTNSLIIGETADLTVELATGDTGTTPLDAISPQTIAVTAVDNSSCNPGTSDNPDGWLTDFLLNLEGGAYTSPGNGSVTEAPTQLSGKAVQITSNDGTAVQTGQEVWNNQRNWYSSNYGTGDVGRKFSYTVWAKLEQAPATDVEVELSIFNIAWIYEGIPAGANGYDGRMSGAGILSATLKPTTEWQLVEFIDQESDTKIWTVPSIWNTGTSVMQRWQVEGLEAGQSIIIDEASIVEITQ